MDTKVQNRKKWRHGFSQCPICKAKLMAYLEKGHSLDDVINYFKQAWQKEPRNKFKGIINGKERIFLKPKIKEENIRRFVMNAIRQTTGYGIYDNYIVEHADRLWTPRNPVLATGELAEKLKIEQKRAAARGRFLIAQYKLAKQLESELKELGGSIEGEEEEYKDVEQSIAASIM